MIRRKIPGWALAASVGLMLSAPAMAQQGSQLRQACRADYRSLCAGVQPGGGRIAACFSANADKLSTPCRQALQAARAERQSQQAPPQR